MKRSRKKRSDSASSAVDAMRNASAGIDLPDGVELRSEEEKTIWAQFTRARARDAWRDFDLVLLAKVVRAEADIRKFQKLLDASGPLIKNKRETLVENPMIRVIDTLQRQQLAIIRSMSLNNTGYDPRTIAEAGKAESEARELLQSHGVESLLARPIH